MSTIHAYTESSGSLPAYINVSQRPVNPEDAIVTVRSTGENNSSVIILARDQLSKLGADIAEHVAKPGAIRLGYTYRDKITGFTGVATGYVQYLTGCNQALIQPKCGEDGAMRDSQWFDQQRLEVQADPAVTLDNGSTPGCDRAAPKR